MNPSTSTTTSSLLERHGAVEGEVVGVPSGAGSPLRVGLLEADSSPRWR